MKSVLTLTHSHMDVQVGISDKSLLSPKWVFVVVTL
jgi:hypothetical protein